MNDSYKEIFDRLGKIERTLTALYNTEVTPTNGLIPQLKKIMDNHLLHHEQEESKMSIALNAHLENHEVRENKYSDRWFKVGMIIVQALIAMGLGLLALGVGGK